MTSGNDDSTFIVQLKRNRELWERFSHLHRTYSESSQEGLYNILKSEGDKKFYPIIPYKLHLSTVCVTELQAGREKS